MSKIYSYNQLKGVIKVGDVVRAVKGKNNPCGELKDDGSNTQKITAVDDKRFSINNCIHLYTEYCFLEIVSSAPRELEDMQVGDVIENREGEKRMVLGVCGRVFFPSYFSNFTDANGVMWIIQKAKEAGWRLVDGKPIREVTQEEVNEKFGEEVRVKTMEK